MLRRSQLYVPGNNERMITNASRLDCDSVILDLEDSVPDSEKGIARQLITKLIPALEWGRKEICVRVNPIQSDEFKEDLRIISKIDRIDTLVIPKSEGDISFIHKQTGKMLIPLIETANGFIMMRDILASDGISAVSYGAADLAVDTGGSIDSYLSNITLKTLIVVNSAAVGIDAIDCVYFEIDDLEGFRRQAEDARNLGFSGKQVIHPKQVEIANEVFKPSSNEIEWAKKVVSEYDKASFQGRGAIRVDGKLVDSVHYRKAKRIIERFGEAP